LARQAQPLIPVEEVVADTLPFGKSQIKLPVLGPLSAATPVTIQI